MANEDIKKFYNETMPKKFGTDYEHERWFRNEIQKAGYDLTLHAITLHVLSDERLHPKRIFELGPGAGTWTKFLVKKFPDSPIDLLDISREMLGRAQEALVKEKHIRYIETDILDWKPEGEYDFFFSSRVLEYIEDKKKFCDTIFSALESGGRGFLITKMPHYGRERILGRTGSAIHGRQIAPGALTRLLRGAGFSDVVAYPVTASIPLLRSPKLNVALGKLLGASPIGLFGMFFAESYCVVFRKP